MTTRREFLKSTGLMAAASMAGIAGAPKFAFGQEAGGKTFIKVFMRGGADGLHLFPAVGDMIYYQHRPNIAIEAPSNDANSALDLGGNGYRAMNPNLEPLMEIWNAGHMMVAPSTAIEEGNRSHFDNQRWIGTGARNNFIDGYLNRYMQNNLGPTHPLRGAVLGKSSISTEIRGSISVPAISNPSNFNLENRDLCGGDGCSDNQLTTLMRDISAHDVDVSAMEGAVRENQLVMLESIAEVQLAGTDYTPSAGGLEYNNTDLGRGLKLVAQLLKAGVPLEVAAMDWNIGWDTHSNQIADGADRFIDQDKGYHRNMRRGASDFLTFYRDIADMRDDVVVLVGTEFGRTVIENGNNGTDHGHGGAWFAFGGPTVPGVGPDVTTLDISALQRERYMPMVVNYRDIVSEIMIRHMGMPENLVSTIFPDHTFTNNSLFSRIA
ncbi:DUF1501 domain-containing protein [Litoreibacter roseus]|uniref:DUF1501 domain-containing protein n=1 Tax=Litoreibacter roseus TaxID=2601869 RepID=A0A6N6JKM2_9RHOB|nr:DUF1501 domain-containing protein [Litoreibacter roseus]GFE66487.1 hypothetical protein KIN_35610 [Litoreibacter roseus]